MDNWHNFLKNLGEWVGSFTQISIDGEILGATPSILTLAGYEDNQLVKFSLRRFGNGENAEPTYNVEQEYRSIGRQAVFFDSGAFSKGSLQVAPFSEFGAEYGFVAGDRRSRSVQLFDKQGNFSSLTLMRELRAGTAAQLCPDLTVEQLIGNWAGTAQTVYADWREPDTTRSSLEISVSDGMLHQQLTFAVGEASRNENRTIASSAKIVGNRLLFEGSVPRQVLLLPDGASCNTPMQVNHRQSFFVEAGWLVSPTERQRIIRSYNDKGEWISATHVIERKVS